MGDVIVSKDHEPVVRKHKRVIALSILGGLLLVAIALVYSVPYMRNNVLRPYCSQDDVLIADFNAYRATASPQPIGEDLVTRIDKKVMSHKDETCGYMLVAIYVQQGNRQKAVETSKNHPNLATATLSDRIAESPTQRQDIMNMVAAWAKEPTNPSNLEIQG